MFANDTPGGTVRQRFLISALGDQWMPAAFAPVYTTVGNARVIPESATLIAPTSVASLDYQVRSVVEQEPTRWSDRADRSPTARRPA